MSHLRRMALLALLMPSVAFGQDDPPEDTGEVDTAATVDTGDTEDVFELPPVLLEAPDLAEGITMLSLGSYIAVRQEDGSFTFNRLPGKHWLMPDSYYREAITKAKQLDIYEDALDRCTARALAWQEKTADAYDSCLEQFDSDEALVAEQVQTIATLESKVHSLTYQRDSARRQRNVAWAITGGLILGATTVTVIAIAP